MTRSRYTVCAALWLVPVCTASGPASGDPPAPIAQSQVPPSAEPRVVSIPKADPETRLEGILQEWEKASSRFRRLESRFSQFKYDPIFEVEQRGAGSLAVSTDGRAYYEVTPVTINRQERSQKVGKDGNRFVLQSVQHERWHWTGKSVIKVDEKERTYEEVALRREPEDGDFHPDPPALPDDDEESPEDLALVGEITSATPEDTAGQTTKRATFLEAAICYLVVIAIVVPNFESGFAARLAPVETFWLARPFLLGMPIADLKQQFHVTLLKEKAAEVWLQFTPIKKDSRHFDRAILILAHDDYHPIALKQIDPTGSETVHIFTDVKINSRGGFVDPFDRPNLKGFRQINGRATE